MKHDLDYLTYYSLIYMLILWQMKTILTDEFNMYNTDNYQNGYCLSYYVIEKFRPILFDANYESKSCHQLISYCLRYSNEDDLRINDITDEFGLNFSELKEKNLTIDQLLSQSVSIDFAEHYQMFLNDKLNSSNETNDYIVTSNFRSKQQQQSSINNRVTCYEHLHCQTYLYCLDWREICDGKSDCIDDSGQADCLDRTDERLGTLDMEKWTISMF